MPDELIQTNKLGEVYLLLQMECELKCKVCPYWGERGACRDADFGKKYSGRLDKKRVLRLIDELAKHSPKNITLSGGEPLLYPGWSDIARYAKEKGIPVALSTNALHISRNLADIMRYIEGIQVSIGGTKEIIASVRGLDFGFEEVIANLKKIGALKKKLRMKTPYIKIIYVVSDLSYAKMREFYEYLQEEEVDYDELYFQHMMYLDRDTLLDQKKVLDGFGEETALWSGFIYAPAKMDMKRFLLDVEFLKSRSKVSFSPKLSPEEIPNYYSAESKRMIKRDQVCQAPWKQVDIYPNGDVMTCPDFVMGNIFENSFDEVWLGKKAAKLRAYIAKNKRFPACQACFYYYVTNEDKTQYG